MGKNVEIELKLHIDDPQDCRKHLEAFAGTGTAFFKDDAYWFPQGPSSADGLSSSGLRVRREEREGASKIILTFKTKEKREGIEINDEKELETTGDPEVLEELLHRLHLEKKIVKTKQGWGWKTSGITLELCEVRGTPRILHSGGPETPEKNLGWFLELEILAGDDRAETVEAARKGLFSVLEQTGMDTQKIEERYYSELLTL